MKTKKKRAVKLLFFLLCCCILINLAAPVYASGIDSNNRAKWNAAGIQVGRILRALAMAGGGVGFAYCLIFEYLLGDENTASKGMNKMLMILGAELALFILPYVVKLASSTDGIHAWTP